MSYQVKMSNTKKRVENTTLSSGVFLTNFEEFDKIECRGISSHLNTQLKQLN